MPLNLCTFCFVVSIQVLLVSLQQLLISGVSRRPHCFLFHKSNKLHFGMFALGMFPIMLISGPFVVLCPLGCLDKSGLLLVVVPPPVIVPELRFQRDGRTFFLVGDDCISPDFERLASVSSSSSSKTYQRSQSINRCCCGWSGMDCSMACGESPLAYALRGTVRHTGSLSGTITLHI